MILTDHSGDLALCARVFWCCGNFVGVPKLNQIAEVEKCSVLADARGPLHVMGDDHDRVVLAQRVVLCSGNGNKGRASLVHEQDHWLGRDSARDTQALLLAAGHAGAEGMQTASSTAWNKPQSLQPARITFPQTLRMCRACWRGYRRRWAVRGSPGSLGPMSQTR